MVEIRSLYYQNSDNTWDAYLESGYPRVHVKDAVSIEDARYTIAVMACEELKHEVCIVKETINYYRNCNV